LVIKHAAKTPPSTPPDCEVGFKIIVSKLLSYIKLAIAAISLLSFFD